MGLFDFLKGKPPASSRKVHAPRKGIFTQCVVVLFEAPPNLSDLEFALKDFSAVKRTECTEPQTGWMDIGNSLAIPYRPEKNGYVLVDVVERPWPDGMGSPNGPEADLFGAWVMGHFGPSTYPGALQRALQHSYRWQEAPMVAPKHRSFVRVRTSYVLGANGDSLVMPEDYDALPELTFVTDVALAVSSMAGALALFNPSGEIVSHPDDVRSLRARYLRGGEPPLEAWANVRKFCLTDIADEPWLLFDTVGLSQLDIQDHEGAIPASNSNINEVPGLLYSTADYDLGKGGVLSVGDTSTDLAGSDWRARTEGEGLIDPPRRVLRWSLQTVTPPKPLLNPKPRR